jgi:hypothetical protein
MATEATSTSETGSTPPPCKQVFHPEAGHCDSAGKRAVTTEIPIYIQREGGNEGEQTPRVREEKMGALFL